MADRSPGARRVHQVSSSGNALVKLFRRALAEGTTREGWLAVEGPLLLEEAIKAASEHEAAGPVVQSVLASNAAIRKFAALIDRLPSEAEVTEVPDRVFTEIAQTETPQGIAALVELPAYDLDAVLARRDALLVIACGVQDPGNLGTIMRSLQALGGSALVTLRATVSPYNPKVVRSSACRFFGGWKRAGWRLVYVPPVLRLPPPTVTRGNRSRLWICAARSRF